MEFKQAVVTQNGRALMAKLLAGKSTQFTKIKVSSTIYSDAQLANLTALTNIKQETTAQAYGNNTATVSVVGAIENTGLQTGYYINTVGLYAMDPDKGEILYSVSSASVNGYMPPDTGVSKSGFEFKIYSEVGNATKVDLTVDPAAFATHEDIERLSILKTAYSWSLDGTDRFCTAYPRENLLSERFGSKPTWTNITTISDEIYKGFPVIEAQSTGADWEPISSGVGGRVAVGGEIGTTFSYSVSLKGIAPNSDGSADVAALVFEEYETETSGRYIYKTIFPPLTIGEWKDFSGTFTIQGDRTNYVSVVMMFCTNNVANMTAYRIANLKLEKGSASTIYTPAPSVDYENAYPDYIGLAPGYSDKPEDYVWLPEPTKNQKKLEELIELKGQVSDIQNWIQAHS